jgi:hypothetical protein
MEPRPSASALDALLSDSIVQLTMRADRVEPQALRSLLVDVGRKIAMRRLAAGQATLRRGALPGSMRRSASTLRGDAGAPIATVAPCAFAPC